MAERRKLSIGGKGLTKKQADIVTRIEEPRSKRLEQESEDKQEQSSIKKSPEVEGGKNESLKPEPETPVRKKAKKKHSPKKQTKPVEEGDPLIPHSFRLPQSLVQRLQRASVERKISKIHPFKMQEIIAESLDDWLRKEEG